jgi:hypothetical protein
MLPFAIASDRPATASGVVSSFAFFCRPDTEPRNTLKPFRGSPDLICLSPRGVLVTRRNKKGGALG